MEADYSMTVPNNSMYKDLHAEMNVPKMTQQTVSQYLQLYNKMMDHKIIAFYTDGYINFIRYVNIDSIAYFHAECRALTLTLTFCSINKMR